MGVVDVQGRVALGSNYMDNGQIMVKLQFFEAAKPFLLLDKLQQLQVSCPVRILHGVKVRSPVWGRALVSLWQVSSRSVHAGRLGY
jgi:hypothetical protein